MYRTERYMECFDNRKCFAKMVNPNGNQYCLHLVGEPYKPGECPYCKENREDKGGRRNAGSSEKASGEARTAEGG